MRMGLCLFFMPTVFFPLTVIVANTPVTLALQPLPTTEKYPGWSQLIPGDCRIFSISSTLIANHFFHFGSKSVTSVAPKTSLRSKWSQLVTCGQTCSVTDVLKTSGGFKKAKLF